ncbi:unnamed protein product [Symbiodinium pilosum]|uniref:Uncharacterized protein n=1 Tax=Symbiodinium pilosum TaxID=2952 RepID=A0A812T3V0_SYMPI|nr:unnamed protein product [Symbiodinium pilosum]
MSSPKRKNGAAKLLKVDFSKEFESRNIPLEDSSTERDAKELRKVASFFGMDGHAVHSLMAQVEASDASASEDSEEEVMPVPVAAAGTSLGDDDDDEEALAQQSRNYAAAMQWLHRPVTPRELLKAKQPRPISINDFPSIFQRSQRDSPRSLQENHYSYFSRRLPSENPEHRKAMEWQTETTRKCIRNRNRGRR